MKVTDTDILYIIKQKQTNYYKIGKSTELRFNNRFRQLNTASPTGLDIVNIYYVKDSKITEKNLHSLFNLKRLNGEWFELSEQDIESIKDNIIGKIKYRHPLGFKEVPLINQKSNEVLKTISNVKQKLRPIKRIKKSI